MVVQVIDVVDYVVIVVDFGQDFDYVQDVGVFVVGSDQVFGFFVVVFVEVFVVVQYGFVGGFFVVYVVVEFYVVDRGQVVVFEGEEQVVEQVLCGIFGWWFVWMYYVVDFDQGFQLGFGWVDMQGVGQVWVMIQVVYLQGVYGIYIGFVEGLQLFVCDFVVGLGQQFVG